MRATGRPVARTGISFQDLVDPPQIGWTMVDRRVLDFLFPKTTPAGLPHVSAIALHTHDGTGESGWKSLREISEAPHGTRALRVVGVI